ncbi:MAG: FAD-dependent oxidoreductase, partial [Alphaproteobacteria bacterium]|nr:FAD-dependent oxidoreductase [Alphaproteobacteria bacterium]
MQKFDLITLGGGSGGIAGSRRAAEYGAKVALIESTQLGGTCVLRGCVPKKLLVYAADFAAEFAGANGYGWQFGGAVPTHDWSHLIAEKNREVNRLSDIYHDMLASSKVTLIHGRAEIIAAAPDHAVQIRVGDEIYEAERVLIATGGQALKPNCPGGEWALISDDMLNLPALPRQVAIIGGGYIAVEFASLLHGLGVEIELILRSDRLLSGFDHELGEKLRESFLARGIKIHTHARLREIRRRDDASTTSTTSTTST